MSHARQTRSPAILLTLAAVLCAPAAPASAQVKRESTDAKAGTITWTKMEASSELVFDKLNMNEFTVAMDGVFTPLATLDAVAVSEELAVLTVTDTDGKQILKPSPRRSFSRRKDNFTPLAGPVKISIAKTNLTHPAHRISVLRAGGAVVVAKARQMHKLPAAVMQQPVLIAGGFSLQITSLRIKPKAGGNELTLAVKFQKPGATGSSRRTASTPKAPFIDTVQALDASNKPVGGGRWKNGDPFDPTGSLTYQFTLAPGQTQAAFQFVIVTEAIEQPATFEVKGVFEP